MAVEFFTTPGNFAPSKPIFLTIHDLGCNHYQYEDFIGDDKMSAIMQKSVWIHLDLPGQGDGDEELARLIVWLWLVGQLVYEQLIYRTTHLRTTRLFVANISYPTWLMFDFESEIFVYTNPKLLTYANFPSNRTQFPPISSFPDAIKAVLDHFEVKQVVLFGEGAGANILARFAIKYDNLVLGAILINCSATRASLTESIKDKIFETDSEVELKKAIENYRQSLRHSINPKNLNKFITAYMNRKTLSEELANLRCPVLLITASLASQRRSCTHMYEELTRSRKKAGDRLQTCNYIMIDGVANVLTERPHKVIDVMQFFLQGLGLLSNLTLQKTPMQINRRLSMEDYDRPTERLQFESQFTRRLSEEQDV